MDGNGRSTLLVTGATGFVGTALVSRLLDEGYDIRGVTRRSGAEDFPFQPVSVPAVDGDTDWGEALAGVDTILHLAARTHAVGEKGGGNLDDYRPLNVEGTRTLARAALRAGVRRFVFLSSIKVNGERTGERAFTADDSPAPEDAYGISKWEAEQALRDVVCDSGLEVVVVRPPLVYGPGVKANFARLVRWVRGGVPLPFGAVDNRRSLVALPNLVDLLVRCVHAPEAAGRTFLVSDGVDVSTPGLIREIAAAMGRRARLWPVPLAALRLVGRMTGRGAEIERLCASLQVDIAETRRVLDWTPPVTMREALRETVG